VHPMKFQGRRLQKGTSHQSRTRFNKKAIRGIAETNEPNKKEEPRGQRRGAPSTGTPASAVGKTEAEGCCLVFKESSPVGLSILQAISARNAPAISREYRYSKNYRRDRIRSRSSDGRAPSCQAGKLLPVKNLSTFYPKTTPER